MTITFPRTDILTSVRYTDQQLQLVSRQETSTQASGVVRGKDFGSALWQATYTTVPLLLRDALAFEAALNSLDGVINVFEAGDLRARYPRAYPAGVFSDTGVLNSVNANNKALSLKSLPPGFILSAGDYLAFNYGTSRALHQIVESVTADIGGNTTEFEVRPHIRPGFALNSAVILKNPNGQFTLLPNSVSSALNSKVTCVVTFKAIQYL